MRRVRAWVRDLAMGARFAVTGGRRGWTRTILTAVGVGLGVCLLLTAASVPHLLESRDDRVEGRYVVPVMHGEAKPSERSFLFAETETLYRGDTIRGTVLRPDGGRAPVPPGLAKLPGAGEMAVSPALADLLASPEGALLKDRLPYRITATIGDPGLVGPSELFYYAGSASLQAASSERSDAFGSPMGGDPMNAVLLLVIVMACVVLLLPVAVFIATATRFGGEQRDRRLAALRLVGSDRAMTRRIAAGESLCESLFGLAAGAGIFMLVRQLAGSVTVWGVNTFPSDLMPNPGLAALIAVAVPACAIAVTLFTLRGVSIEPLGVVRNTAPRRRRLWWRVLLPVAGLALLLPLAGQIDMNDSDIASYQIVAGSLLLLLGITALLPWLVEAVVGRLRGGPVSWQLAVRRLQLSSGTASRAVSGIMVAAAGGIALQMLFTSMQSDFMKPTGMDTARAQLFTSAPGADGTTGREIIEKYAATKGVTGVIGIIEAYVEQPRSQRTSAHRLPGAGITVGDCPSLRELAKLPSCKDGDVFIASKHGKLRPPDEDPAQPGAQVDLHTRYGALTRYGSVKETEPELWRIPATAEAVDTRTHPMGRMDITGILATPSTIDVSKLQDATTTAMIRLDPKVPDAAEYARNTAAAINPVTDVRTMQNFERDSRYSSVRTGLFVGAAVTMLVVAASMFVSTVEQLRERKRLLSVLVAFGTPRATLSWSVLWQTAVPIVMGLALAITTGIGLGLALLRMIDKQVTDWWAFLPVTGVGAGLILLVTALSLPPLWRMTRPDGLRTE
ncbi:FtsX-like permease family protein [Streptomyces sp. NPDC006678]|uniref:FtsX-like permease family protein n=1 Tax=Streptomyces sp. NPDC006678 TaxID=3157185 RepID=UPI0033EA162E